MKILVAPASYRVGRDGSDPEVSFQLLKNLSERQGLTVYALMHQLTSPELGNSLSVIQVGPSLGGSMIEQMIYQFEVYRHARGALRSIGFDIVHHMSPFQIGSNFSPLIALGRLKEHFVIGPIASNISMTPDLAADFNTRWGSRMDDAKLYLSPREEGTERVLSLVPSKLSRLRRVLSTKTLARADAVIAINKYSCDVLRHLVDKDKIHLIPDGVDTEEFSYREPEDCFRIVSFGPLQKRRGLDVLIKSMSIVTKHFPQARLLITGNGPQRVALHELVRKLGLEDVVSFAGYLSRLSLIKALHNSRLYCHPSLHETFGISILEAMSVGRPVIAADSVGPKEILLERETGFLVPRGDSISLASAIFKLFGDYSLTLRMGKKAREVAERIYDWKQVSQEYASVYKKVSE